LRYSPPDTCIEINIAKTKEHRVRLAIRDHGPGVAAEDLDLIFARYRQGRPSPYSSKHGFGLGLHVVQTYVELMGGSVSVTNHPEGGALFECVMDGWSNGEAAR
jgi:two-component system OmpR family sensor kinase